MKRSSLTLVAVLAVLSLSLFPPSEYRGHMYPRDDRSPRSRQKTVEARARTRDPPSLSFLLRRIAMEGRRGMSERGYLRLREVP